MRVSYVDFGISDVNYIVSDGDTNIRRNKRFRETFFVIALDKRCDKRASPRRKRKC